MSEQAKPGKAGCIVSIILGVIGIGAAAWGVWGLVSGVNSIKNMVEQSYVVPGRHVVNLKAGKYMLMHMYDASVGGKRYQARGDLDLNVSLTRRDTGAPIDLVPPGESLRTTAESQEQKGSVMGTFTIEEPGEYVLEASYHDEGPETLLAIVDESVMVSMGTACVAFVLAGLILLAALIFGIIAIVKMSRRRGVQPPMTPYQYPPAQ